MRFNFDRHSTSNMVSLNQLTLRQWMTVRNDGNGVVSGAFGQCAGTSRAAIGQCEPTDIEKTAGGGPVLMDCLRTT